MSRSRSPIPLFLVFLSACGEAPPAPPLAFFIEPADAPIAGAIEAAATAGVAAIEGWFGAPFPSPVEIRVFPDRASFDRHLTESWGMPEVACWMVGGAEEDGLVLLSPRVWTEAACDHDPDDEREVRDLVVHELVHVYHMQANPTNDFEGVVDLDWFVEGLATLVSGQLARAHAARAREAVAIGAAPARLADAWSGPYRYGVAGSLVGYLETTIGRPGIVELLTATNQAQLLERIGTTEPELLAAWQAWVRAS